MGCTDYAIVPIIKVIKTIFLMVEVIAPVIAIVALMILFGKLMVYPQEKNEIEKVYKRRIKNTIISMVIIFFIPFFINLVMYVLGENFTVSACWNSAEKINFSTTTQYIDRNNKQRTKIINEKNYDKGYTGGPTAEYVASGPTAERIASAAEYYAWPEGTSKKKYSRFEGGGSTPQFMSDYRKWWPNYKNSSDKSVAAGTCCCHFARTCVVKGLGKKFSFTLLPPNSSYDSSLKNDMQKLGFTRIAFDGKYSTLKRGDVLYYRNKGSGGHVWIFLGNHKAAEGSHGNGYGGRITRVTDSDLRISNKEVYYIFRATK